MRSWIVFAVVTLSLVGAAGAQSVEIDSFGQNGTLSWSAPSGSVSTIEWASSLTPGADWRRHWVGLSDIRSTNAQATAQVPMFYRVSCWTNGLLLSMPIGRTYVYCGSNSVGETWTQEVSCVGLIEGPQLTNGSHYVLLSWKEIGREDSELWNLSASDRASYNFRPDHIVDTKWKMGDIGTSWTNVTDADGDTMAFRIETNETVTVPAGAFQNCIKFREYEINEPPGADPPWAMYWWVKPGLFFVKFVDYFYEDVETKGPEVLTLESWRDE